MALVPANDRDLVRTLLDEPGWALVDVDAVAFLFARATPDHLEAIEANQQRLRRLNAPAETTEEAIVPAPRPSWLAALFGPKNRPFEAFGRGANFLQIGMFDAARRELEDYFSGTLRAFDLPIDWTLVHGFALGVLRATARVPFGHVATYGEMAASAGSPRAARAAGNALHINPIPIVVPCHRIVPASGGIGGYGGGEDRKKFLLELEGAIPAWEPSRPRQ